MALSRSLKDPHYGQIFSLFQRFMEKTQIADCESTDNSARLNLHTPMRDATL